MGRYSDDRGPGRRSFGTKPKAEPFVPWKPEVCEAPGCRRRHPSFSAYGREGPWTCREHRGLSRQTRPDTPLDPPTDPPPGRLL